MGLRTFLQDAAPPHLMDQLPQDDDILIIYNKIDHYAYKLFERLTTSSENKVITSTVFLSNLLYFFTFFYRKIICHIIICGTCYAIMI